MGARGYVVVPMQAQERCVGVLALGWQSERTVDPTDRALLEAIASSAPRPSSGPSSTRTRRAARRRAERLAERLTILQDISTRLAEARHSADVAEVITSYAAAGVGATCALLRRLDAERDSLVLVASRGLDPARAATMAPVPVGARSPVADAVRELRPVTVASELDRDEQYPHLRGTAMGKPQAYVALPLVADDRAVGVLVLGWDEERNASGTDIAFLLALARQSAQALERAWLYEAEQMARHAAENTASRLRLQQDLTARLSESVDTDAVADVIVRYATSALGARGTVLHRVDERSRRFELLASHGTPVDPAYRSVPLAGALPICDAVRRREPVLVTEAADGDATAPPSGPSTAFVVLPLLLEDRAIGALSVTWAAAVEYGTADAEFLEAVASQCAQALDRARLYDETRSVARTLQGSLLPTRPPAIPGLEVAVRYRPISRRNEVGGDFYDVFRIAPGRWGVVIGDVSGKGVPAASLTALARYTVRAAAKREASPADVLRFLNETMLEASAGAERFATVAYLDVRLSGDGASARLAVGGHPLPVLRRASGEVLPVGTPGMAIGLLPMADVDDTALRLARGDTLVLYTDGVAEARSPEGEFAGDLVEHVLRIGGAPDVETVADRIERATLDFQAGDPRDDLAVVVLRVPEGADVVRTAVAAATLECDRASVAQARRVVAEFLTEQGLAAVSDVAVLLTSEVVTNAVLHAQTAVGLRVSAVADRLRVEVTDGHPGRPVRRDARTDASSGRGLLLLDRLAAGWDVRRTPDGKLVWFELDLPG
jgi:serine phosphatase RsbU (regulator of sigma subunit)/anti-sigma regulatory factor (Ser/Thr protein kinase)